jgi:hypothetical protein
MWGQNSTSGRPPKICARSQNSPSNGANTRLPAHAVDPPDLPAQTVEERTIAELFSGASAATHPMRLVREKLAGMGVVTGAELAGITWKSIARHVQYGGAVVVYGTVEARNGAVSVLAGRASTRLVSQPRTGAAVSNGARFSPRPRR